MSKSWLVYLACFLPLNNCLLFKAGTNGSFWLKEECNKIDGIEIRYKEFFELYLGHNPDSGKIEKQGILHRSLSEAVNDCCPGMPLRFTRVDNRSIESIIQEEILYHHFETSDSRDLVFYFPEFAKHDKLNVYAHDIPFLNLRKSPGLALVMLKSESHFDITARDIVVPSWPIFALVISLSWAVGILGWALERFQNSDEFPRPFVRGMFEGFWWAIITLSTVGYGDKSPKTVLARILCVLWILAGAVLLSLFTANITSLITASRIMENKQTMGKKIGVINMEDFVEIELNLGAQLIEFNQVQSALAALKEKTIDRLLFPHYLDLLYLMSKKEFSALLSDVYIPRVFDKPFQIGMVLSHPNASSIRNNILYTCLEIKTLQYSKKNQYDYSIIDASIANAEYNTFNTESTLDVLYAILGAIGSMFILGITFDIFRFFRKKAKKVANSGVV